jgi:hypothetical protein
LIKGPPAERSRGPGATNGLSPLLTGALKIRSDLRGATGRLSMLLVAGPLKDRSGERGTMERLPPSFDGDFGAT